MDKVKIAKELLVIAKNLMAAEEKTAKDFIKEYSYKDANSDFETKDVNRGEGKLTFTVFLTGAIQLDVEVEVSGEDNLEGKVTTKWKVDNYVYKNGGFAPETTPKTTDVKGTYGQVTAQVTEAVAKCTEGLSLAKGQ